MRKSALVIGLIIGILAPFTAFAQPSLGNVLPPKPTGVPDRFRSVPEAISTIFNFVIILAGTIFIILILIGGIQYLTAAGNEEGTGKAKKLIVDGIIGLVITLAAWAIGIFILRQVGFTGLGGGGTGVTLPWGPVSWNQFSEYDNYNTRCTSDSGHDISLTSGNRFSGAGTCNP